MLPLHILGAPRGSGFYIGIRTPWHHTRCQEMSGKKYLQIPSHEINAKVPRFSIRGYSSAYLKMFLFPKHQLVSYCLQKENECTITPWHKKGIFFVAQVQHSPSPFDFHAIMLLLIGCNHMECQKLVVQRIMLPGERTTIKSLRTPDVFHWPWSISWDILL